MLLIKENMNICCKSGNCFVCKLNEPHERIKSDCDVLRGLYAGCMEKLCCSDHYGGQPVYPLRNAYCVSGWPPILATLIIRCTKVLQALWFAFSTPDTLSLALLAWLCCKTPTVRRYMYQWKSEKYNCH